eukprot:Skav218636  [mRNA]  locus=scaffold365:296020:297409:- [translate_table: standard]
MWRPDAGPCVAQVADWGEHPDDVEYMRQLKALPKKVLKRREVIAKDRGLLGSPGTCAVRPEIHFSVACWNLSEYSRNGGVQDQVGISMAGSAWNSHGTAGRAQAFTARGIELDSRVLRVEG